jgi:hypothetical protein
MEGDVVTMQEITRFVSRGIDKDSKVQGSFGFCRVKAFFAKHAFSSSDGSLVL